MKRYRLLPADDICRNANVVITSAGGFEEVDIMCKFTKKKCSNCEKRDLKGFTEQELAQEIEFIASSTTNPHKIAKDLIKQFKGK